MEPSVQFWTLLHWGLPNDVLVPQLACASWVDEVLYNKLLWNWSERKLKHSIPMTYTKDGSHFWCSHGYRSNIHQHGWKLRLDHILFHWTEYFITLLGIFSTYEPGVIQRKANMLTWLCNFPLNSWLLGNYHRKITKDKKTSYAQNPLHVYELDYAIF